MRPAKLLLHAFTFKTLIAELCLPTLTLSYKAPLPSLAQMDADKQISLLPLRPWEWVPLRAL
ncbi:hypothetical protein EMIT0P43_20315 [Pseudomonas jessenii]